MFEKLSSDELAEFNELCDARREASLAFQMEREAQEQGEEAEG